MLAVEEEEILFAMPLEPGLNRILTGNEVLVAPSCLQLLLFDRLPHHVKATGRHPGRVAVVEGQEWSCIREFVLLWRP
jgi:hypothetical protein